MDLSSIRYFVATNKGPLKKVALIIIGIIMLFIIFLFFKGYNMSELKVSISGQQDGKPRITVSPLYESDELSEQSSVESFTYSVKLKPGNYKLLGEVFKPEQEGQSSKSLSTQQNVELKPRQSLEVMVELEDLYSSKVVSLPDTQSQITGNNDTAISTSIYGALSSYNFSSGSVQNIRNEPAFLDGILGVCLFSNGNAVALDDKGAFYKVVNNSTQPLDVISQLPEQYIEILESRLQGFSNSNSNFLCYSDTLNIYNSISINSEFTAKPIEKPFKSEDLLSNFYIDNKLNLWSYDVVDQDSFDLDSSNLGSKKINMIKGSQLVSSFDTPTYISGVSSSSSDGLCYFYSSDIYCRLNNEFQKVHSVGSKGSVKNIAMISDSELLYTDAVSLWKLNLKTKTAKKKAEFKNFAQTQPFVNGKSITYIVNNPINYDDIENLSSLVTLKVD
jgi:hypothetical protein